MKSILHFIHKRCNKQNSCGISVHFSVNRRISQKENKRCQIFMSLEQKEWNLRPVMENSLRLPEPHLNMSFRARSCILLEMDDPGSSRRQRIKTFGRTRSISDSGLPNNTTNNARSNDNKNYLEILYKTTDIVLIICAVVFIISSITSIVLWLYGFTWVDLVNNKFHFKP